MKKIRQKNTVSSARMFHSLRFSRRFFISANSFQKKMAARPTAAYAPIHLVAMATPMVTPHSPSGTSVRFSETFLQSIWK